MVCLIVIVSTCFGTLIALLCSGELCGASFIL